MKNQILIVLIALLTGCAAFQQNGTTNPAGVENLCYDAANIGTASVLLTNPEYRPEFEIAYNNLDYQIKSGTVNGYSLHQILLSLPVKELKSPEAVLSYALATSIYHRATGETLNVEINNPYVIAAATGVRDGMGTALGR